MNSMFTCSLRLSNSLNPQRLISISVSSLLGGNGKTGIFCELLVLTSSAFKLGALAVDNPVKGRFDNNTSLFSVCNRFDNADSFDSNSIKKLPTFSFKVMEEDGGNRPGDDQADGGEVLKSGGGDVPGGIS